MPWSHWHAAMNVAGGLNFQPFDQVALKEADMTWRSHESLLTIRNNPASRGTVQDRILLFH